LLQGLQQRLGEQTRYYPAPDLVEGALNSAYLKAVAALEGIETTARARPCAPPCWRSQSS